MLAPRAIRLDVHPSAALADPRHLRARTLLRGAEPAASDPCRLQLCASAAPRLQRGGGLFRGHADGILVSGPELPEAGFPCLWEHKCLGDKGWRTLERDGLEKAYPQYAAQVSLYQAYLDVTEHPAIFTAVNANTCACLHLLVPFNAEQAQIWSDRAVAVIEATRAGELLPRAYDDPADWRCKACGHRERCWNRP
jgi:hypothetical protein